MYAGNLVRLRALRTDDAEMIARWLSDSENILMMAGGGCMPVTPESEREWIAKNSDSAFAIETLTDSRFVGVCRFFDLNNQAAKCKACLYIGNSADRGKGYGSDALNTLIKHLFIDRNMHRVGLDVYSYNERAVRMCEKLGFIRDATFREQVYAMGKYWDEYAYSILAREYM